MTSPTQWAWVWAYLRRQWRTGKPGVLQSKLQRVGLDSNWTTVTATAAAAKLLQSCPTLCDPTDRSPPGSPVPGILQAGILEWVAFPFSRGSSQPRTQTQVSCIAGGFFTSWTTKEALIYHYFFPNITYLCVCTKPRLCSFYPFSYLLFSLLSQSF